MQLLIALVALALAGCASQSVDLASIDPGPAPATHESDVKAYLARTLLDPYSVKDLSISIPYMCSVRLEMFAKPTHGWCSQVSYNAKNVYGGYVGVKTYNTFTRNNQISQMEEHWEPR